MNNTNDNLLSLGEVARRLPSHAPGKRVHVVTIRRWIASGRLRAVRRGRYYFVPESALDELIQEVEVRGKPARKQTSRQREAARKWADDVLRERGLG